MRKIRRLKADTPTILKSGRIVEEVSKLRKYYLQSEELRRYSRPRSIKKFSMMRACVFRYAKHSMTAVLGVRPT